MWFIRPKFEERYRVYSDVYIDGSGITDGRINYPWPEIKSCTIDLSDPQELEYFFGDDYHERPFSIFITHHNGTRKSVMLFGQSLETAIKAGMAINHYSGRQLIPKKFIDGDPIPWQVIVVIAALTALLVAITLYNH